MYPANRDEIIKGLEDLINSIQKILQAVAAEKAAAPEPNAITEQGAASALLRQKHSLQQLSSCLQALRMLMRMT